MKPSHEQYARARDRVIAAQEAVAAVTAERDSAEARQAAKALASAGDELRAAEAEVADEIEAAWEANRQAVQDANQQLKAAQQNQVRVETECGEAARSRYLKAGGVGLCFLNEEERQRVEAAAVEVEQAQQALSDAQVCFKAGVTAEQLAGES